MTKDYEITVQDGTGKRLTLFINGASVDEMGGNEYARELVEDNTFANAIADGLINADAYLIERI